MVAIPIKCTTWCTMTRAKIAIALAYLCVPILCIPIFVAFSVVKTKKKDVYLVNLSDLAKNNPFLMTANFWIYRWAKNLQKRLVFCLTLNWPYFFNLQLFSVVIKLVPCATLTVVMLRLVISLRNVRKRRFRLFKTENNPSSTPQLNAYGGRARVNLSEIKARKWSNHMTEMLLSVLLLFLLTEFPQGVLGLLSGVFGERFFTSCYIPFADLMDLLTLINSAINVCLYCGTNRKFRQTFAKIMMLDNFKGNWVRRRSLRSSQSIGNTFNRTSAAVESRQGGSNGGVDQITAF